MRALFTSLPAFGHAAPLCAIAAELAAGGDAVAWVADDGLARHLLPEEAPRFPWAVPGGLGGADGRLFTGSVRRYFEHDLPELTAAALGPTEAAIAAFRPDVVVVDQHALAGAIAARRAGVPWVSVHVMPVGLDDVFAGLPGLAAWVEARFAAPQRAAGVDPLPWPLRSPHGTVVPSTRTFLGPRADVRPGDALVGALTAHRPESLPDALRGPAPRAFLTLGTLLDDAGAAFAHRAVAALGRGPGSAVAALRAPVDAPANVRVAPWVPQLAVLRDVDVVVCHAGQNTVTEALACGVPLVVVPVRYDQPAVAARVEATGVGVRLAHDASEDAIADAVSRVRGTPSFREAARREAVALREAGGAAAAAAVVRGAR